MVKNWDMARKHKFFEDLTTNLRENRSPIPSLRLFKGLIKDQRDRQYYASNIRTNYNNYSSTYYGGNYNNGNVGYSQGGIKINTGLTVNTNVVSANGAVSAVPTSAPQD